VYKLKKKIFEYKYNMEIEEIWNKLTLIIWTKEMNIL
jgi:hypothetical protein